MSEMNAKSPVAEDANTPTKRTPKRKADAFQKESEELLKTLGVSVDMEDGRRRTRSSARGSTVTTPVSTPATPPAKRARGPFTTPKRTEKSDLFAVTPPANEQTTTPKKRGHVEPKKLIDQVESEELEELAADDTDSTARNAKMDTNDSVPMVEESSDKSQPKAKVVEKNKDEKLQKKPDADKTEAAVNSKESVETKKEEVAERKQTTLAGQKVEEDVGSTTHKNTVGVAPKDPIAAVNKAEEKPEEAMEVDETDPKPKEQDVKPTEPASKPTEPDTKSAEPNTKATEDAVPAGNDSKASTEEKPVESEVITVGEEKTAAATTEEVTTEKKGNESNGNPVTTPKVTPGETPSAPEAVKENSTETTEVKKTETDSVEAKIQEAPKEPDTTIASPNKGETIKCATEESMVPSVPVNNDVGSTVAEKPSPNGE